LRRHEGVSRRGGRSRNWPSSGLATATSSLPVVHHSAHCSGLAPASSFQFHSPEAATNSTSSLPAETTCQANGLVRRESDLGRIVESDKVSTSNADKLARLDVINSQSLTRSGIQTPCAVVHRRGQATSNHLTTISSTKSIGGEEQDLRTSITADERPQGGDNGPQVTAARPRVLALNDHITCLRQKNLRRRDDVIRPGDHVTSSSVSEPASAEDKGIDAEW